MVYLCGVVGAPKGFRVPLVEYLHQAWETEKFNRVKAKSAVPDAPVKFTIPPTSTTKPHYYPMPDPFAYAKVHGLDFVEASAIKYITRWRKKDGLKDLEKAAECINRLIQDEKTKAISVVSP